MAIVIETFLTCDGPECPENFGVDHRSFNEVMQRNSAQHNGWVTIGKKDYCPKCKSAALKNHQKH